MLEPKLPKLNRHRNKSETQYIAFILLLYASKSHANDLLGRLLTWQSSVSGCPTLLPTHFQWHWFSAKRDSVWEPRTDTAHNNRPNIFHCLLILHPYFWRSPDNSLDVAYFLFPTQIILTAWNCLKSTSVVQLTSL